MDLTTCVNFSVKLCNIPFSQFLSLKDDTISWILKLFTEVDENCTDHILLRSRTYHPIVEMEALHCHFGDYSRDLNFWAYNNEELLLYSYCEGDTTLAIYDTIDKYNKAYNETLKFYKENW